MNKRHRFLPALVLFFSIVPIFFQLTAASPATLSVGQPDPGLFPGQVAKVPVIFEQVQGPGLAGFDLCLKVGADVPVHLVNTQTDPPGLHPGTDGWIYDESAVTVYFPLRGLDADPAKNESGLSPDFLSLQGEDGILEIRNELLPDQTARFAYVFQSKQNTGEFLSGSLLDLYIYVGQAVPPGTPVDITFIQSADPQTAAFDGIPLPPDTIAHFSGNVAGALSVSAVSPDSGAEAGGTRVTLTGTRFVDGVSVTFDGMDAQDIAVVSNTELTCTTPPHAAGTIDVVVTHPGGASTTLADGFTYLAAPAVSSLTVDPPSPLSSGTVQITITFNTAMDPAFPPQVLFGLAGEDPLTVTQTEFSGDTWTGTADISPLTGDGGHTITIRSARNTEGIQMLQNTAFSFVVDTAAPQLTISQPSEMVWTNAASFTLAGSAADSGGSGVSVVAVSFDDGSTWQTADFSDGAWTLEAALNAGENAFKVRAEDAAGNVSAAIDGPTLTYDPEKPRVTRFDIEPAPPLKAGEAVFTIDFSEAMDTQSALTVAFGNPARTVSGGFIDTDTWQGTATIDAGADGTQTLSISGGRDPAGNTMDDDDTRTFVVDTTAPSVTIDNPSEDIFTDSASYSLAGTVSDAGGNGIAEVAVSLDGGNTWTTADVIEDTWTVSVDLLTGANMLRIRTRDGLGNTEIHTTEVTLTFYPPLRIRIGGQDVTGQDIFVSNVAPYDTRTITVSGGSGDYRWQVAPGLNGVLNDGEGVHEKIFTALTDQPGVETLIVTDGAAEEFYRATLLIHVVTFVIEGPARIERGKVADYSAIGAPGTISWSIQEDPPPAAVAGVSPDSRTASVQALQAGVFTLTAADSISGAAIDKTVEIIDPISVSTDSQGYLNTAGTIQFNATGGKGQSNSDYTWSIDAVDPVGSQIGTITDGTLTVTPESGLRSFRVVAGDKMFPDIEGRSPIVTLMDPLSIEAPPGAYLLSAGPPASYAVVSGSTHGFGFTGGSGEVDWTVEADGAVDRSGRFTAPQVRQGSTEVTLTAVDRSFSHIEASVVITAYAVLTIRNKPAEALIINAGGFSEPFAAEGGGEAYADYQWRVDGPVPYAPVSGADFVFEAPAAEDANFAGKYVVTVFYGELSESEVPDGEGFSDQLEIFVPIQLVAWDKDEGRTVPPVCLQDGAITLKARGVDTHLRLTYDENPLTDGETVFSEDKPLEVDESEFTLQSRGPGWCEITVQAADDPEGMFYPGSLRVEVVGTGDLSGRFENMDPAIDPSAGDIRIELQRPGTESTHSAALSDDGSGWQYAFPRVPYGFYRMSVWIEDQSADPAYVADRSRQIVEINTPNTVFDISLPPLTPILQSFECELKVREEATQNVINNYEVILWRDSDKEPVFQKAFEDAVDGVARLTIERGFRYRLFVEAEGFIPFSHNLDESIDSVLIELKKSPQPSISVGHVFNRDGFRLKIIAKDVAGTFTARIDGTPLTLEQKIKSRRTYYLYTWKAADWPAPGSPNAAGDSVYPVTIVFADDGTPGWSDSYFVAYVEKAADKKSQQKDANKDENEDEFEADAGDESVYKELDVGLFYPPFGTTVPVTLKDMNGGEVEAVVVIPPIPVEYLYIDDFDEKGIGSDNLNYAGLPPFKPDHYDIQASDIEEDLKITPTTLLRVVVTHFTFGRLALASGVNIKLERASDGKTVRYNPILGPGRPRDPKAPQLQIPLLLNSQSRYYRLFSRLSRARARLVVRTLERGDRYPQFHDEPILFDLQDDGLATLYPRHLTAFGFGGTPPTPGADHVPAVSGSAGQCFVTSAAERAAGPLLLAVAAVGILLTTVFASMRRLRVKKNTLPPAADPDGTALGEPRAGSKFEIQYSSQRTSCR